MEDSLNTRKEGENKAVYSQNRHTAYNMCLYITKCVILPEQYCNIGRNMLSLHLTIPFCTPQPQVAKF
jgi:hypothetical protein